MRDQTALVVDDDQPTRRMMRRVLERHGWTVLEAGDGRSGVLMARDMRPSVVLLDLRMPGSMSGIDALRALADDVTTSAIPVIVVSASSHLDADRFTREYRCAAFVDKPIDVDELLETMQRVTRE